MLNYDDFHHTLTNNFMFLDPPYDSEFTDYGYCTFGKEEQKKLAKCFKETNIKCLMIIGKTPFIEELYKDYIVGEYDKKYRFNVKQPNEVKEAQSDLNNFVQKFLDEGDKVKVTLRFRGREMAHQELGAELMERVAVDTAHLGKPDVIPKVEGRQMIMIIYPNT